MPVRRVLDATTPGDHFSPRTGSAIPTVVDGLARAAQAGGARHTVVVDRSAYAPRYDSANPIEYTGAPRPRRAAGRWFAPLATAASGQPPNIVLALNAPIPPRLLRDSPAERTRGRLPRSLADLVHVVRNGVDTGRFSPGRSREPGRLPIVFLGRRRHHPRGAAEQRRPAEEHPADRARQTSS